MWQKIIKATRDYFYVSHSEARGTVVLVGLMLSVIVGTWIYRNTENDDSFLTVITKAEIDSLFQVEATPSIQKITLHSFDPNTETDFESLGIPSFLAHRITSYRKAGGVFRSKNELMKIYNFPDSLYLILVPYINLPEKSIKQPYQPAYNSSKPLTKNIESPIPQNRPLNFNFDLAAVDSIDLQMLPGIGPTYAARIVKYRTRLGGFYSLNQLYEVYGLPKQTATLLLKNSLLNTTDVTQINLNEVTFKQLLKHPYLEYEDVQNIFNFRRKYGGFNQVEDIQHHRLVADSTFIKIAPYLKI